MSIFSVGGSTPSDGFELKSARFDDGSSSKLQHNFVYDPDGQRQWTFSTWVKRAALGTHQRIFGMHYAQNDTQHLGLGFNTSDKLNATGWSNNFRTSTAVYRDPAAWYHVMFVMNTRAPVQADRMILYVNGERITALDVNYGLTYNEQYGIGYQTTHYIGWDGNSGATYYFDGELAEMYFCSKDVLGPETFGETNVLTGQWQPLNSVDIKPTVSFGINGFYMPFNNDALTTNFSGNTTHTIHTVTPSSGSNPHTDTTIKKFGTASGQWNNSTYLSAPDSADWCFGDGDYTIDFWLYHPQHCSTDHFDFIISQPNAGGGNQSYIRTRRSANGNYYMMTNFSGQSTQSNNNISVTLDEWNHWAICKDRGYVYFYKDGVNVLGAGVGVHAPVAWPNYNVPLRIGYQQDVEYYNGYADEIRISKGIARFPAGANFSVPTAAYTADEYDVLLLHCDGSDSGTTFTDSSWAGATALSNNLTVTGNTTNKRVYPVRPGARSAAHVIGPQQGNSSVMYFDGEQSYLEIPDSADWNFGSSDFTIEMWVNMPNVAFQQENELACIWSQANTTTLYNALWWVTDSNSYNSKGFNFMAQQSNGNMMFEFSTGIEGINNYDWNHVAVVRNGSNWNIYVNGISRASRTGSETLVDWSFPVRFGSLWHSSAPYREWKGYMDEIRISNVARYTANFTAPTEQFVTDANTKLLIHGDGRQGTNSFRDSTPGLAFVPSADISVEYLVVGGGGAGGRGDGGGGAAGGYRTGTGLALTSGTSYAVQVGAGGVSNDAPGNSSGCSGQDGSPSTFSTITAEGGGGGGGGGSGDNNDGRFGGSGGGAGGHNASAYSAGGSSTAGEGNNGGNGDGAGKGGGGGGSSAAGNPGNVSNGTGGAGTSNDISGSPVTYAAGGNGDNHTNSSPAGTANSGNGTNGTDGGTTATGAGGSGVVIITYQASSAQATGGTITTHGSGASQYYVHTFTNTGHVIDAPWGSDGNSAFNVAPKFGTGVYSGATGGSYLDFNEGDVMEQFWIPGSSDDADGRNAVGGEITYETWVSFKFIPDTSSETATYGDQTIFAQTNSNTSYNYTRLTYDSGLKWRWRIYNSSDSLIMGLDAADTLTANTWYHVAFVMNARKCTIFRDGVEKGTAMINGTPRNPNRAFEWGRYSRSSADNSYFSGFMDESRISSSARYTANFTPSTTPFTPDKDTLMLMHMDGGGGISSTTNLPTQPGQGDYFFSDAPNAIFYESGVPSKKSTIFFDGSGDNLSIANSGAWDFGTDPFTWEAWVNLQDSPASADGANVISLYSGFNAFLKIMANHYPQFRVGTGNSSIADGGSGGTHTIPLKIKQWYHIAAIREPATQLRLYVDGILSQFALVSSADVQTSGTVTIGSHSTGIEYLDALVDQVRLSNTARYTGTYTQPSAAFTSDANTSLLLHCDGSNDGTTFTDSSSNAHTVAVGGNIVTKTGEKKFGTASAYFNGGSGNKLTVADDASLRFGTGDFTIEAWVYPVSAGGSQENMIVAKGDASTYWMLRHEENNTQGRVRWFGQINSVRVADIRVDLGATGWAYDTWHHIAAVRNGNVFTLYVDGDAVGGCRAWGDNWDFNTGDPVIIGNITQGTIAAYGYIDELRISKGIARYTTGHFTPPTAPFITDTNTKLLVQSDFTEGGLGADHSGNYNYFTPVNMGAQDMSEDNPQDNYCTFNPLAFRRYGGSSNEPWTFSEGNLKGEMHNSNHQSFAVGTHAVASGKFYFEYYIYEINGANGIYGGIGGDRPCYSNNNYLHGASEANFPYVEWHTNAHAGTNVTGATAAGTHGLSCTTGDIVMTAFDLDNGKCYWGKNGTWFNSGNPATGTNPGVSGFLGAPTTNWIIYWDGNASSGAGGIVMNCGQDSSFAGYVASQANQDENDKGDFYYAPPAGFLALCTDNLEDPSIALPGENFNTVLWSGVNAANSITGVGFQPDMLWFKARNNSSNHRVQDAVRGATNPLYPNDSAVSSAGDTNLNAFDSDGFSMNQNPQSGGMGNFASDTYVGWNWKAGGAPTATNSAGAGNVPTAGSVKINGSNSSSALAGTIPAKKISANTTAGFSIVQYTGTGSGGTIAHGLSKAPDMIISKGYSTGAAYNWRVGGAALGMTSADYSMRLDLDNAEQNLSGVFGAYPAATVWTIGTDAGVNDSGKDYIVYCFHNVEGYSKVDFFGGNADTNGSFIYTGFRPAYTIIKRVYTANDWMIGDDETSPYNVTNNMLRANITNAQQSGNYVDYLSNGFKLRLSGNALNGAGRYLYLAFAEYPFKTTNAR